MHWLWLFLLGLVIGIVAKLIMPGKDPGGFIITGLLGIAGVFLGSWLAQVFNIRIAGELGEFVVGVIGAIILLFIYRLVAKKV